MHQHAGHVEGKVEDKAAVHDVSENSDVFKYQSMFDRLRFCNMQETHDVLNGFAYFVGSGLYFPYLTMEACLFHIVVHDRTHFQPLSDPTGNNSFQETERCPQVNHVLIDFGLRALSFFRDPDHVLFAGHSISAAGS